MRRCVPRNVHGLGCCRQGKRHRDPAQSCLAHVRRELAITERHGCDERLHAVAENVNAPSANLDPPAQRPRPQRGARVHFPRLREQPVSVDAVDFDFGIDIELVRDARDATVNRKELAREAKHGIVRGEPVTIGLDRNAIDQERRGEVGGDTDAGTFELARRAGAGGGSQVDRGVEVAIQRRQQRMATSGDRVSERCNRSKLRASRKILRATIPTKLDNV